MKQFIVSICCMLAAMVSASAQDLPRFRVNVSGGYTYFMKSDPNDQASRVFVKNDAYDAYRRDLRFAPNAEANAFFILRNGLGFGAKFAYTQVNAKETDLLIDAGNEHYSVLSISERNSIFFLAPTLMYTQWIEPSKRFLANGALSVGFVHLDSSGMLDLTSLAFYGDAVGFQVDFGVDYFLTRNISLGLSSGYFYTKVKEVEFMMSEGKTKLPEKAQPNLSSIKLNLSLSLNF